MESGRPYGVEIVRPGRSFYCKELTAENREYEFLQNKVAEYMWEYNADVCGPGIDIGYRSAIDEVQSYVYKGWGKVFYSRLKDHDTNDHDTNDGGFVGFLIASKVNLPMQDGRNLQYWKVERTSVLDRYQRQGVRHDLMIHFLETTNPVLVSVNTWRVGLVTGSQLMIDSLEEVLSRKRPENGWDLESLGKLNVGEVRMIKRAVHAYDANQNLGFQLVSTDPECDSGFNDRINFVRAKVLPEDLAHLCIKPDSQGEIKIQEVRELLSQLD